jgi:hypothetical protein
VIPLQGSARVRAWERADQRRQEGSSNVSNA